MIRRHHRIFLLATAIVTGTLLSFSQESEELSLDNAIKRALQNNTNIINSKLDLKIAQKKIWEITLDF